MANDTAPRSTFLDCTKGFAICTVVLGHTFQSATTDFDHYLPFRLIYSFHMPMFMFVSGMTASLSFSRRLDMTPDWRSYSSEIGSKATRLVVPFLTWALISYFLLHPEGYGPVTWLFHVLRFSDDGLWFLLVLFECSCVLALISFVIQRISYSTKTKSSNRATLYLLLVLAWPITSMLLRQLPYEFGLGLTKALFWYFFAGFVFHIAMPNGLPNFIRWVPYVVFIALAPFWYRTEISPVAALFPNPGSANLELGRIVALAGTFTVVDFSRRFTKRAPPLFSRIVAFLGKRSLDIYAIHFYFVAYFPPVIAAMAASLGVSFALRTNPVTSWLCLGQRPLNIWPWDRLASSRSGIAKSAMAIPKE